MLMIVAMLLFAGAIALLIAAGACGLNYDGDKGRAIVVCIFGVLLLVAAVFCIGVAVYDDSRGFPAGNDLLEKGVIYQLVAQHTVEGKHLVLVVGPGGSRLYKVEQPLPAGTTYVRAVQRGNEKIHLEPVPTSQ